MRFSVKLSSVSERNNNEINKMNNENIIDPRVSHTPMFGVLDPEFNDFEVTHASQDEVDCERDILGTTPEDDWFDDSDEETTDMSALSPAFRELYSEYGEKEDDDDE